MTHRLTDRTTGRTADRRDAARLVVAVLAAVFVVSGVLGLARGAAFTESGMNPGVHLVFGLTGFAVVGSARGARRFLIGGGVAYVLWHYGVLTVLTSGSAGWLSTANDWLNLWLAASMIALAYVLGDRPAQVPATRLTRLTRVTAPAAAPRRGRTPTAGPSRRPRGPRPAAGNRPRLAGVTGR